MSLVPDSATSITRDVAGARAPAAPFAYRVQSLCFRYAGAAAVADDWVLDGLTFDVDAGGILGIAGPNGSGKTSLLKLMGKILRPQAGGMTLFGRDLAALSQRDVACTVALVPQEFQQVFPFTVMETVLMGRYPRRQAGSWSAGFGWESAEDLIVARQMMEYMDILHLADRVVLDLSGGERQRCVIARALAQVPQVLLLDEPTAYLDLHHQIEICAILRRLTNEGGLTVVLVSHDLNLVGQYCDRVLMLREGRLFGVGRPDEIICQDSIRAVYGCDVLVDQHPESGLPRVTLPGRETLGRRRGS